MEYTGKGYLRIKTYSADGALPISGAVVRIFGTDEENYGAEYMQITDVDGLTGVFTLPAPKLAYSLSSDPAESPYATYRAEVRKNGYEDIDVEALQIFDTIAGVLPLNMVIIDAAPHDINGGETNANAHNT